MGPRICFLFIEESGQYGEHENPRNFKEDLSGSFLMEEEQSDKCNKCCDNTIFCPSNHKSFRDYSWLLYCQWSILDPSLESLTGLTKTWGRLPSWHLLVFRLCSLRFLIIPQKCQVLVLCWLLSTDLPPCDTKSSETKSKIPQGMGSTLSVKIIAHLSASSFLWLEGKLSWVHWGYFLKTLWKLTHVCYDFFFFESRILCLGNRKASATVKTGRNRRDPWTCSESCVHKFNVVYT